MSAVAVIFATLSIGGGVPTAGAATIVSGATETSVPFVIDPADDPRTSSDMVNVFTGDVAFFVQKMPAARTVRYVTLGDLKSTDACDGQYVTLEVLEASTGDFGDWHMVAEASARIGPRMGRVTWTIPDTVFHAGQGYALYLTSGDYAPCSVLEGRSWAHNASQVNAGPAACAPWIESHSSRSIRYWHVKGQDDVDDTCRNGFDIKPANFDPSMPTGWLVVTKPYWTGPMITTNPPGQTNCPTDYWNGNGQAVTWPEGGGAAVCEYPQFAGRGLAVPDGWYYAPIFDTPPGEPSGHYLIRDMFVRLSDQAPPPGTGNTTGPGDPPQQHPPTASDEAGTDNPGAPNLADGRCLCADPVDPASGNLTETTTDIAVMGRGLPLSFSRTYNSMFAGDPGDLNGHAGAGWSTSWSMRLTVPAGAGPAVVHNDNGSTVPFTKDAAGQFTAPYFVHATLSQVPDGTYVYRQLSDHNAYRFDAAGRLISAADRNGYQTSLAYTADGRLQTITNAAGDALHLSYDADGHLHEVADDSGRNVTYGYDAVGNLTAVADVGGGTVGYAYDPAHHLTALTDPNANTTATVYDGTGRVISQTDAEGNVTSLSYATNQTVVTDPRGVQTKLVFDSGQVTHQTEAVGTPDERTTVLKYDDARNLVERDSALGTKRRFTYDADGRLLTSTDELSRTTTRTYTDGGYLETETDPAGETTTYAYDASGNVTEIDRPLAGSGQIARERFTYDPAHPGQLTSTRNAADDAQTYTYDAAGRLASSTDGEGGRTTYVVNAPGWVTATTDPRGNVDGATASDYTTHLAYDAFGRVTKSTDALGHETVTAYDPAGNRTSVTDANGNRTTFAYDRDNRLLTTTRPDQTHTDLRYDAGGHVILSADGLGNATRYGYDNLGRLASTTDPNSRTSRNEYDEADRRTGFRDARGEVTSYTYDDAGQLTKTTFSDPATHEITFGYDADGRRTSMTDGVGTSTYAYDSLGRLTKATTPGPIARIAPDLSADDHETVDYTYDLAGRVTKIEYPSLLPTGELVSQSVAGQQISVGARPTVTRRYDHAGRLVEVDDFKSRRFLFSYDAAGHLTLASAPNGTATTTSYDRRGQITRITSSGPNGTLLDLPYDHDAKGLTTATKATAALSSVGETFGYDRLSQLTDATVPTAAGGVTRERFAYDPGDRLTRIERLGVSLSLSYDDADQLTKVTDPQTGTTLATLTYNANGDRTAVTDVSGTKVTYDYDQRDQLTRYQDRPASTVTTAGAPVASSLTQTTPADVTYRYNGLGLRADLLWDPSSAVQGILEDPTHLFISGPGGLPLEQVDLSGRALFYHHDQLGSTRLLTEDNGHALAYSDYDAYGRALSAVDAALNPLGYAGQYTDAASGLVYMRARWYDPSAGTFLTPDPLGLAAGDQNVYGYAGRDPIDYADPTGLCRAAGMFRDALWEFGSQMAMNLAIATAQAAWSGSAAGASGSLAAFEAEQTAALDGLLAAKAPRGRLGRLLADERGGASSIPGFPFRGPNAPERAYENLAKHHGVDRGVASDRLHKIKEVGGLGATDDVVIGRTGDVYDARTEEWLGSLTDKSLGR